MDIKTHVLIDRPLCGHPLTVEDGSSTVRLETTELMRVDAEGLVHGGFVFGAADYAAMLAVNDPNVVLGKAETVFRAPVAVGDTVELEAVVKEEKGRKRIVEVRGSVGERLVFEGTFTTFVLEHHVLDPPA